MLNVLFDFNRFSWLHGPYGITGPNKTIPRPHVYLTVERGKKKSEVLKEIKKQFKCDPKKYFELFREPERKPSFKYLSKPTSGGSILAVKRSSEPNPLRVANDIVDLDTSKASGTLTMFCCQNDEHYALTCFHVACTTDELSFQQAFNLEQRFLDIQSSIEWYEDLAKEQEYHYRERNMDRADENENPVASPVNYSPLGRFSQCSFDDRCDIMSIQVDKDVQVDCGVGDIGNPDWDKIYDKLYQRVKSIRGGLVIVQKVGFLPSDNHKGYVIDSSYTYDCGGDFSFGDAIIVKGMAGTFLEPGDSGALIYFYDRDKVKQAFAYGVGEIANPYSHNHMSSDEEWREDSHESGSSENNDALEEESDDEKSKVGSEPGSNDNFSADDSDTEGIPFGVEGPVFICLKLDTALKSLNLLDEGCFSPCGNTQ